MSPNKFLTTLLLAFFVSVSANAADADALVQTCAACHGSKGEGNDSLAAPALAGQRAEYLARQLRAFKAGARGENSQDLHGVTMRTVAAGLNEDAIDALANHFSKLPAAAPAYAGKGDAVAGKLSYESTCAACHGQRAEGYAQLQSPNLRILSADYMTAQMNAYVKGWRGNSPASEQAAVWMHSIANQIIDPNELANIFAYLGSLSKR